MSEPHNPGPTGDDSDQPPLPPVKRRDDDPPMDPNPYMGGGKAPA